MSAGGYGKPPVEHRFKPGHAKLGGRKAKLRPFVEEPENVLDQIVAVTVDGRRRSVRAAEAVLLKQTQLALEGDTQAARLVLKVDAERPAKCPSEQPTTALTQFTFTTYREAALKGLGILTRDVGDSDGGGLITTWAARQALQRRDPAVWDRPDATKLAFDLEDPMAVLDLVPAHLQESWTSNSRSCGNSNSFAPSDGETGS
jgi:hypothetical protein